MPCPAIEIRDAVLTAVLGAGVIGLDSLHVRHRKRAQRFKEDPDPLCLIVLERERPTEPAGRTNRTQSIDYPVLVVLVRKQANQAARSDGWEEEARYAIQRRLWRNVFLGLAGGVKCCQYDSNPVFPIDGIDSGYDVSGQRFTYTHEEEKPPQGD